MLSKSTSLLYGISAYYIITCKGTNHKLFMNSVGDESHKMVEKRQKIQWDEVTIAEHDKERGTRYDHDKLLCGTLSVHLHY